MAKEYRKCWNCGKKFKSDGDLYCSEKCLYAPKKASNTMRVKIKDAHGIVAPISENSKESNFIRNAERAGDKVVRGNDGHLVRLAKE